MTEQEERFIHFDLCITSLNNALSLLKKIQGQQGNSLVLAAFRFALIEYCKPYKFSYVGARRFKLEAYFIPVEFISLHERIIRDRDQVHAHSDLNLLDAKLHIHSFMEQRHTQISSNYIHGGEELCNIEAIVSLIEGTLNNMYAEVGEIEKAITF